MKVITKDEVKVTGVVRALQLDTKREAEAIRAGVKMRYDHVKRELEKPLAAGVARILREELEILDSAYRRLDTLKCHLQK